jgi:hypothetical protein
VGVKVTDRFAPPPGIMLTRAPKTTFAVADWASTIAQLCSTVGMVLTRVRVTLLPTLNVSVGPGLCMVFALFPNPKVPWLLTPA